MALVNKSIAGLYNGVSQQAPILRLDSQCEAQENALSSLIDGLMKRPPTELLNSILISGTFSSKTLFKIMIFDDEPFIVAFTSNTGDNEVCIKIYDKSGIEQTIENDTTYSPDNYFDANLHHDENGLLDICVCPYEKNGYLIANKNVTVEKYGTPSNHTIDYIYASREELETATKDASVAVGSIAEIIGSSSKRTSYYLIRKDGYWEETVSPSVQIQFNSRTLPRYLIRRNNLFILERLTLPSRRIGDDNTSPYPSFVDNTINDMCFFKGRLCFLSDKSIYMTLVVSSNSWYVFPQTALDVLDSDPIDITPKDGGATPLKYAIPFHSSLVLFSDDEQFIISSGENLLTPKTVIVNPTTKYSIVPNCRPERVGSNIYFSCPQGDAYSVREMFIQPGTLVFEAQAITEHVAKYINAKPTAIVSIPESNMLVVHSIDQPKTLWIYKYFWANNERVQASWSKWTFDEDIISLKSLDNKLIMINKNNNSTYSLVQINLEDTDSGDLGFRVHLDNQMKLIGSYVNNETCWIGPFSDSFDKYTIVDLSTGLEIPISRTAYDNQVYAVGDYSGRPCIIGKKYTMRYSFTPWRIKNQDGTSNLQGRLQIRKLALHFQNTGVFKVSITPLNRDALVHDYSAIQAGITELDKPALATGDADFLVMANAEGTAIEIINDDYMPSNFQQAEFEGFFVTRSRNVG